MSFRPPEVIELKNPLQLLESITTHWGNGFYAQIVDGQPLIWARKTRPEGTGGWWNTNCCFTSDKLEFIVAVYELIRQQQERLAWIDRQRSSR